MYKKEKGVFFLMSVECLMIEQFSGPFLFLFELEVHAYSLRYELSPNKVLL